MVSRRGVEDRGVIDSRFARSLFTVSGVIKVVVAAGEGFKGLGVLEGVSMSFQEELIDMGGTLGLTYWSTKKNELSLTNPPPPVTCTSIHSERQDVFTELYNRVHGELRTIK